MLKWIVFVACMVGVNGAPSAHAKDVSHPIAWDFDSGAHRFRIQTDIQSPSRLGLLATENKVIRTNHVQMDLVTTCQKEAERGRNGWDLLCTIEDIALRVQPFGKEGTVDILNEWRTRLTGANVSVAFRRDGRLIHTDLEVGGKSNARDGNILLSMEVLLGRAFSAFDETLPKRGEDPSVEKWRVNQSQTMMFPSPYGTVGTVRGVCAVVRRDGKVVQLSTHVKGMRQEARATPGVNLPAYEMRMDSHSLFDQQLGALVARTYVVTGSPTASSGVAQRSAYVQSGVLERVEPGEQVVVGETSLNPSEAWLPSVKGTAVVMVPDAK